MMTDHAFLKDNIKKDRTKIIKIKLAYIFILSFKINIYLFI